MILQVIASVFLIIAIAIFFGLTPEQITDDLMKIITPNDTMHDKAKNIRGNRKRHKLYKVLVNIKGALASTGKSKQFTLVICASVVLFAAGVIVSILINNLFLMPVLAVTFALIPFFYITNTLSYYEKQTKEELETALSIITTSYERCDDIVQAVRENIQYIKPPLREVFMAFEGEATAVSSNIKRALYSLREKVDNDIFKEWVDTLILCQDDRTLKDTLQPVVQKLAYRQQRAFHDACLRPKRILDDGGACRYERAASVSAQQGLVPHASVFHSGQSCMRTLRTCHSHHGNVYEEVHEAHRVQEIRRF